MNRRAVAEVGLQFLRQPANFLCAAVTTINRAQQLCLGDDGEIDVTSQYPRNFIIDRQVGRIGHRDQKRRAAVIEHHGAPAPSRSAPC